MAFSPQRILKSKYLAYRYFESMNKDNIIYKNDSIPILAFETIVRDAVEKVNALTGKSYTHIPSFPEHKAMYESNINLMINGLVDMCTAPDTTKMNNFMIFTIKNNKKTPHVFVFNKQEMCMYTLVYLNRMMKKSKYTIISRIIDILGARKLESVVGITQKELEDECTYAQSQLPYIGGSKFKNVLIYQSLCNCNKINILVEYLVTNMRKDLFNYFPTMYNKSNVTYKPIVCSNENKLYYIIPYTQDIKEFDISHY